MDEPLVLEMKDVKLLRDYFMKAGYINYEIPELHDAINKIIIHADWEGSEHASLHGGFGYAARDAKETV